MITENYYSSFSSSLSVDCCDSAIRSLVPQLTDSYTRFLRHHFSAHLVPDAKTKQN